MYQAIVKRIAHKNFLRVNNKDFEALRQWFGGLSRLGKHLTFTVQDVWVKGLPHDTTIIIR